MPLPIALDYRPAILSNAGIGRATRELARALGAQPGIDLHLFAHSLARARRVVEVPAGATLHRLPIAGRALPALARLGVGADHLAGRADVFHWTDYTQPPLVRAAAVLTLHDLAFVRDPTWHGQNAVVLRDRTRCAIGRAAAVVVPSRCTAEDLRAFAPGARTAHVVPFGADHVAAGPLGPHPLGGRPFTLCLGTIEPRKNHRTLLRAWRLLAAPRPLLVVVGEVGWECAGVVAELRAAAAEGLVAWHRDRTDSEVWALLRHASLLVYPSLWEGFGFPPLEAMQCGVPVVGNDMAPLRELGDGALELVDATDPAALAGAIERVLRDPDLARARVAAGRARAAQFRWRDCAAAHAAIYREVTG